MKLKKYKQKIFQYSKIPILFSIKSIYAVHFQLHLRHVNMQCWIEEKCTVWNNFFNFNTCLARTVQI